MVARQPVALADVQGMFGPARENGCREIMCWYAGPESLCESVELFFEVSCYLFCPCYQFYEEFPDHRSDQSSMVQDLNRDDPFGSMNVMSDEMRCDFLFGLPEKKGDYFRALLIWLKNPNVHGGFTPATGLPQMR
jgi:hypothetical protein